MADDERRAEIEAVRWATRPPLRPEDAEKVIAALDRVRDARDDEAGQRFWCPDCGASEIHHDWCEAFPGEPVVHGNREAPTARSPQDEDHEACIEAAVRAEAEKL